MSRATLDYLEGLPAPETFIGASGRRLVNEFAKEQMRQALSHIKVDAQGQQFIEPIELIARLELAVLTAQIGTTHDMDLAELTALGVMSALNRALDGYFSPSSLVVRRAITSRVHTLLEQRPELLHPNLRVAKTAADEGSVWMLRFLVQHNVALDPERLLRMARGPGPAGGTLQKAIQEGKSYGAPLLEEAIKLERGCTATATALVLADTQPPELDEFQVQQLWTMCAAGVAGAQWQFDQALQLLHAIRQRQDDAGGDGHRMSWPQGKELLEAVDFSWASARGAHPTMGLIYETTLRAAYISELRQSDVSGFPGDPLHAAAAALNAVLEPELRLELTELSSENLVKLIVLCPRAAGNTSVQNFWSRVPAGWNANNPSDLLDWVASRTDSSGESLGLEVLDSRANDFSDVLGSSHFNALRAGVAAREMNSAIDAQAPRSDLKRGQQPEPAQRRRTRNL